MMRRKGKSGKRILQCPNPIAMASGSDVPPSGKMMGDAIHSPVVSEEEHCDYDDGSELVNTEDDGGQQYRLGLWWGSGYTLDTYRAWAFSADEALNHVVAYIERKHPQWLEESDECASDLMKEYDEESPEFHETFMYVDATMEGADEPHYIWAENLSISEL